MIISNGKAYQIMVDNLLSKLRTNKIHRIDVNFQINDKYFYLFLYLRTIDNVIGRTAHIKFLDSDPLTKMFVNCFDHLFA